MNCLQNSNIPKNVLSSFKDIYEVYDFLKDNQNFEINPIKGLLTLIKKKSQNEIIGEKI